MAWLKVGFGTGTASVCFDVAPDSTVTVEIEESNDICTRTDEMALGEFLGEMEKVMVSLRAEAGRRGIK